MVMMVVVRLMSASCIKIKFVKLQISRLSVNCSVVMCIICVPVGLLRVMCFVYVVLYVAFHSKIQLKLNLNVLTKTPSPAFLASYRRNLDIDPTTLTYKLKM